MNLVDLSINFLWQEVRQAQQDVCDEHKLIDLRLEIMGVQEDVRRESESEASSTHSPLDYFSQFVGSRYQVSLSIEVWSWKLLAPNSHHIGESEIVVGSRSTLLDLELPLTMSRRNWTFQGK